MNLLSRIRPRLVDDWHRAHKFLSVQIAVIGAALEAFIQWFPHTATDVWNSLPGDMRSLLPEALTRSLPILLMLAIVVARITKKPTNAG